MTRLQKHILLPAIIFLCTLLVGCGDDITLTVVNNADLPGFNDITTAPPDIQTAARAVVRVYTAGSYATGFFTSPTGQLVTNDHVLGDSVCPKEGCYLEITVMHQRGAAKLDPVTVFAVPQAVDVGLDLAVAQLYDSMGMKLATPDYLTFNSRTSSELLGTHITIVGHPEGNLKKWTDGVVATAAGKWFQATAFVLPGDSGSPVLDDSGRVVGLLHRGPASLNLFTANSANVSSIATASASLLPAMTAPLPATMLSVSQPTTAEKFLAYNSLYQNARVTSLTADGVVTTPLKLLGTACDAALARQDYTSPNDMEDALSPCYDAQTWIECRLDADPSPYATVCPDSSDTIAWRSRFKALNQKWLDMTGQPDYDSLTFGIASLETGMFSGLAAGAQELQQAVTASTAPLDLSLAYYLAAFNLPTYAGVTITDYLTNYRTTLHYELGDRYIAYGTAWLFAHNRISRSDMLLLLNGLYNDPDVSLGTKLDIEDLLYERDAL